MHAVSSTSDHPRARAAIQALQPYSRAFAGEVAPDYRSSSNEAPWPPPESVVDAAVTAVKNGNRYPTLHADDLIDAVADANDVTPGWVAVGDGSLSLLTYLLLAYINRGDEVVHAWRSYEAYPITIVAAGGAAVPVANSSDGTHDLPAMAAAVTDHTVAIIVCAPNNPTGATVGHAELVEFLGSVPPRVIVILDQAYADFADTQIDNDPVRAQELLEQHANLVILRTFSKSYGLAGLRVGYLLANPAIAKQVKAIQPPFPVSAPAIAAAIVSLAESDARRRTIDAVIHQRTALTALLRHANLPVIDSAANFLWLPLAERAEEFASACSRARIAVRCFTNEGVRISLGEPGLVEAVRQVIESQASPPTSGRVAGDAAIGADQ
ncbi:MAG: aminotransferase class I/II-fold pyridoxal phosphate-dependent enzyme [Microbacteriaceae bacterium]|nr:MAG: aminotransferase class I/II-fold pyridoxal phosphate-dependent enzyme [Microbacteriaceae bacterium]